jgi:hypothetical protein
MVKDSTSIAVIEAFRQQYGDSNALYDRLAAERIQALKGEEKLKVATATSPQAAPLPEHGAPSAPVLPDLARLLQTELKRVGCDPGAIDGRWGDKGEAALQRFARYAKLSLSTDVPTVAALEAVKGQRDRICPLECGPNAVERDGACVAKAPVYREQPKAKSVSAPKAPTLAAPKRPKQDGSKSGLCWAIEARSNTIVPCSDPRAGPKAY